MSKKRAVTKEIKSFRPKKYEDFEIVDAEGHTIGHGRVQPSGIKWAPANAKVWYGVHLAKFQAFMEPEGKQMKK